MHASVCVLLCDVVCTCACAFVCTRMCNRGRVTPTLFCCVCVCSIQSERCIARRKRFPTVWEELPDNWVGLQTCTFIRVCVTCTTDQTKAEQHMNGMRLICLPNDNDCLFSNSSFACGWPDLLLVATKWIIFLCSWCRCGVALPRPNIYETDILNQAVQF